MEFDVTRAHAIVDLPRADRERDEAAAQVCADRERHHRATLDDERRPKTRYEQDQHRVSGDARRERRHQDPGATCHTMSAPCPIGRP